MRKFINLVESPIGKFEVDSDFETNRSTMLSNRTDYRQDLEHYEQSDVDAIQSQKNIQRVKNAFAKCPYKFNLFFTHIEEMDYDRFITAGNVDVEWLKNNFCASTYNQLQKWIEPDAINVIFTNNLSDNGKISLKSPWMVAHRIAHSIIGGNESDQTTIGHFEIFIHKILKIAYNVEIPKNDDRISTIIRDDIMHNLGKILGHNLGTMKSARNKKFVTVYEWYYETFVQYIMTGKISINPLPETLDGNHIHMTKDMNTRKKVLTIWNKFPVIITKTLNTTLNDAVGKIWVE